MALGSGALLVFLRVKRGRKIARFFHQPQERPIIGETGIVLAFHPQARAIGEAVLRSGGNAFDAFVATVAAENVLAEGASTLAGPLGVMTYTRSDHRVLYLDAEFNDPCDSRWRWSARMRRDGRTVLVPGAPRGLAELTARLGSKPLSELLEPAMRLALDGFSVSNLMAAFIARRAEVLRRTPYGRTTYFSEGGKPLRAGATIRLPAVGSFLRRLSKEGTAYVYGGEWGQSFLQLVQAHHGVLTAKDLSTYAAHWAEPWRTSYCGHELWSSPGYGGLWTQLALKTLEHIRLREGVHYSDDGEQLETILRIIREVWAESWLLDYKALADRQLVESRCSAEYTRSIAERVVKSRPQPPLAGCGSHSYHITVVDREGNAASGTTTIEAEPWGEGLFVEGIPLSTAGAIPWNTTPGRRRLSPFSIHFAFQQQRLRFAVGAISNSVAEAAFQFLVNLIHYGMPVETAASMPRCGTFPATSATRVDLARNWIDPRIPAQTLATLKKRGLYTRNTGFVDTGLGSIVALHESGRHIGAMTALPYIENPFGTGTPSQRGISR